MYAKNPQNMNTSKEYSDQPSSWDGNTVYIQKFTWKPQSTFTCSKIQKEGLKQIIFCDPQKNTRTQQ